MSLFLIILFMFSLLIVIGYILVNWQNTIGWFLLKEPGSTESSLNTEASIIILLGEKESHIINCLSSIINQDYPETLFEIIIAGRNISDEIKKNINEFISKNKKDSIHLIESASSKTAIETAIHNCKNDIILSTNAECTMDVKWLSSMISLYEKSKAPLISGTAIYDNNDNIFNKSFSLWRLLQLAIGAGSIKLNNGILVEESNILFEKNLCRINNPKTKTYTFEKTFILQKAKNLNKIILFNKSKEAFVYNKVNQNLKEVVLKSIKQIKETIKYYDFSVIVTGGIFVIYNVLLVLWGIVLIAEPSLFRIFLFLFIAKIVIDLPIAIGLTHFIKRKRWIIDFLFLQFLMPVFVGSLICMMVMELINNLICTRRGNPM